LNARKSLINFSKSIAVSSKKNYKGKKTK